MQYANPNRRLACVACLEKFYQLTSTTSHYLEAVTASLLLDAVSECILHYCALARLAVDQGLMLWLVTPKLHFFWHLAYFARYIGTLLVGSCVVCVGMVFKFRAIKTSEPVFALSGSGFCKSHLRMFREKVHPHFRR